MAKTFQGVVVSDSMKKTIVVRVDRMKTHPIYKKKYKVSKRYKVHDERGEFHVGERISFEECRPLSREVRWRAVKKAL